MRFTAVGTGTISLPPARACAGHLVERGAVSLLLDCGSGVAHRLAELALAWKSITHIALTHFHIDHHGDLPTLVFAWKYGDIPARSAPLTIVGPVGTQALLERLTAAYGEWLLSPGFPITVREITPGERIELAPEMTLEAHQVPHTPESVAYCVHADGHRIVYTGDTGYDEALADWARGCDLLVCECSLSAAMAIPEHLTPEQCGALAARARPGHLALTHFYPPVEQVDIAALVAASWQGSLTRAHDGWHFDIEDD